MLPIIHYIFRTSLRRDSFLNPVIIRMVVADMISWFPLSSSRPISVTRDTWHGWWHGNASRVLTSIESQWPNCEAALVRGRWAMRPVRANYQQTSLHSNILSYKQITHRQPGCQVLLMFTIALIMPRQLFCLGTEKVQETSIFRMQILWLAIIDFPPTRGRARILTWSKHVSTSGGTSHISII